MSNIPPPPPLIPFLTCERSILRIRSVGNYEDNSNSALYDLDKFVRITITQVRHVAQTGPNCGLAALAMVATLTPCTLTVDDIFNDALRRGFTRNGEMFSAMNMAVLGQATLSSWFTVQLFSDGLAANNSLVIDTLYNGDLMLVPYDADCNNSPCCKKGHKAHWALVCGVMVAADGAVFVAARHGKSRHLAVWPLDSLQRSNDNLAELDPKRAVDDKEYVIPHGGVAAGLASQFITILRKKDTVPELDTNS